MDLIKEIHKKAKVVVQITMTTYDDELCRIIEPNVCVTSRRFEVLEAFREEGIPTVVWICPILPFINDTEENFQAIVVNIIKPMVMRMKSVVQIVSNCINYL